ncbi:MAG TPA: hypothetical protein VFI31_19550 [Pirellulales bacterium]|nr:hypothetical protein [Pirellulales bacterium]
MHRARFTHVLLTCISTTALLGGFSGCNKSTGQSIADQAKDVDKATEVEVDTDVDADEEMQAAANVVRDFLQAIKVGDESVSNELLTPLARQKTAELDMAVAPMGSETASFTIGDVELPAEAAGELAHVASTWTDVDEDGQERTDEILWVLRREEEGWRIGGMATKIFEDEPPLLLDFEDPADMRRKQQLAEAEMERRARAAVVAESETASEEQEQEQAVAVPVADQRHSPAVARQTKKK